MRRVRIGSRGSVLALAQSDWVKRQLLERYPDAQVDTMIIKTSGDRFVDTPVATIGGKGVFTKEIEEALLRQDIDVAVHSMKDLPSELPEGLVIAAVPKREDPRDVLVSRGGCQFAALPAGARIATGSLRRKAQLLYHRADLVIVAMRGNVDTRLRKLDEGQAEALVMAAAGLKRIGREARISEYFSDDVCVSAVAQGALGIETRADALVQELLAFLRDAATHAEVSAERALLARLGGGCHLPIAARAKMTGDALQMIGVVASPDGKSLYKERVDGQARDADALGRQLAERLLMGGADKILALA